MKLKLVTEGEWSKDGRYVTIGSTTWREPPLPLTVPVNGGYESKIVGRITRVWRTGNVIWGEVDYECESVTVDTDNVGASMSDAGDMIIDHPRIVGGCAWQDDRYIWRHDE